MAKKEKVSEKSTSKTKKQYFYVEARRNAYLADGKFIAKGEKARVTIEYVERLRAANDQSFIITKE